MVTKKINLVSTIEMSDKISINSNLSERIIVMVKQKNHLYSYAVQIAEGINIPLEEEIKEKISIRRRRSATENTYTHTMMQK